MTGKYWDRPWSLVDGCTPCSPGCEHCWSMAMGKRFKKWPDRVTVRPDRLDIPLKTRRPTVFSVWNDLFHEKNSNFFIGEAHEHVAINPRHTFLILTKRPERMKEAYEYLRQYIFIGRTFPLPNVWLGVTVCNQAEADEKIPLLLQTTAAHRWVSIEPMLRPINLERYLFSSGDDGEPAPRNEPPLPCLHCVVLGGETGPGARPMHPDWARKARDDCKAAGVPFFFKQWGEHLPSYDDIYGDWNAPPIHVLTGDKSRLLDGREHNDLPWRTKDA